MDSTSEYTPIHSRTIKMKEHGENSKKINAKQNVENRTSTIYNQQKPKYVNSTDQEKESQCLCWRICCKLCEYCNSICMLNKPKEKHKETMKIQITSTISHKMLKKRKDKQEEIKVLKGKQGSKSNEMENVMKDRTFKDDLPPVMSGNAETQEVNILQLLEGNRENEKKLFSRSQIDKAFESKHKNIGEMEKKKLPNIQNDINNKQEQNVPTGKKNTKTIASKKIKERKKTKISIPEEYQSKSGMKGNKFGTMQIESDLETLKKLEKVQEESSGNETVISMMQTKTLQRKNGKGNSKREVIQSTNKQNETILKETLIDKSGKKKKLNTMTKSRECPLLDEFSCPICSKVTENEDDMKRHTLLAHIKNNEILLNEELKNIVNGDTGNKNLYALNTENQVLSSNDEEASARENFENIFSPSSNMEFASNTGVLEKEETRKNTVDRNSNIKSHTVLNSNPNCKECEKCFYNIDHLISLMPYENVSNSSKHFRFSCNLCKASYEHQNQIYEHMLQHRETENLICTQCAEKKNAIVEEPTEKTVIPGLLVNCGICRRAFIDARSIINDNKIRVMVGSGKNKTLQFKCRVCDEREYLEFRMIEHIYDHCLSGEFVCKACNNSLNHTANNLLSAIPMQGKW